MVLHVDIETFCSVDIAKSGSFKYIESPDFEVLLIAYAIDDGPVMVRDVAQNDNVDDIIEMLRDPNVIKVAHNCDGFERPAFGKLIGYMPPEQWIDTMALCAMNGLPMSLDAAGAALKLTNQKLKEGTALINYFCKPCKPTISNKGRIRNMPWHNPEKWSRFIEYCRRDVEVMQTIYYKLCKFPVPEWEKQVRYQNCRVNERGVMIDRELVESAIYVDEKNKAECLEELQRLTGLENPNSVSQLKEWLEAYGLSLEKLDKQTVADLKETIEDPILRRVLELRQLLCKTSSKKYTAMMAAASRDDRIRGMMMYYGAGRTGRFSGRLVQPQNLPQNHLNNIGTVRELVRNGDTEMLDMLFESVPDVLSQLIRTALVAKPGHTFLVADYSAIEARVIAYLAKEQWRMDVFANGGDIYCSSASQMFHVPVVKHGVNGHLRQKGKIAELACIAEGQLVLTDHGLIPIEKVTKSHKVWDGIEWVSHGGAVYRGEKEVIKYGKLEATPDHTVWVTDNRKSWTVRFGDAAASGARLTVSGVGRTAVRLGNCDIPGEAVEREDESLPCFNKMQQLRKRKLDNSGQSKKREVEGLSELFSTQKCPTLAGQEVHRCKAEVYESEGCELQELWCERDKIQFPQCSGCVYLHDRNEWLTREQGYGIGQNRCERELRTRESSMGNTSGKLSESKKISKVYDIANAGPRHRFTVSGVLVHNCGYGGGLGAMKNMGGDRMGLTDDEMIDIVTHWREASPNICKLWREAENCAKKALQNPGKTFAMKCGAVYGRDSKALRLKLPSGRVLTYWDAHLDEQGQIAFMAQNQVTRKWETSSTWGGKLVENLIQSFARDVLCTAMLRLEKAGFGIVFSVHDEVIVEEPIGGRTWKDVAEIMSMPISWAEGLILTADGYETPFYMKD